MSGDKEQLLADLAANMPAAMRALRQWLVWAYWQKPGATKPAKMPSYANGAPRGWPMGKPRDGKATEEQPNVVQGAPEDRAALVSFDEAVAAARRSSKFAGVGFAFLPGDGLVGVDIDHAINPDTGEISGLCRTVLALCPSYAELSVSGTGLHIILAGHTEKFKDDLIGLEVYCDLQFFTCTGKRFGGGPPEVEPLEAYALAAMRGMVMQSLEQQRAEREAAKAADAPVVPVPAPGEKPKLQLVKTPAPPKTAKAGKGSGSEDFQRVNAAALAKLSSWVPVLFPGAKPHDGNQGSGYRVSSKLLNRDLQEDLAITPKGIKDFGPPEYGALGRPMSAIDCVVEWRGLSLREALYWLAPLVGEPLTPPKRQRPGASDSATRPGPPPDGEERARAAAGPDAGGEADHDEDGENGADDLAREGGGRGRRARKVDPAKLQPLFDDFAYQYGSDIAWSVSRREAFKIANLKHTYGQDAVKIWMNHGDRRVVEAKNVVFEPGRDVPAGSINLYAGLALKPVEGGCGPMLELLQWLCKDCEADGPEGKLDGKDIADWVLRWIAIQLQRPGTKMQTALVFHGPMGTGKNLLFDVVRDFFGDYGVMVGQSELDDKFNTWLSRRMFIVGDEVVSRQEMYHSKNKLKWIITQTTKIPIRAIQMDVRFESNYVNLVFLSNEDQPLALEEGDRRFLVVHTPRKDFNGLYDRVRHFLDHEDGAAKFLHHLLTIPLSGFEAGTQPPLTKAKRDLIELGYHASERFVHEWLAGYLELPMTVCSVEQLFTVYLRWCGAAGERFTGSQQQFTSKVRAFVQKRLELDESGKPKDPALDYRVFTCPDVAKGRKSVRCWVPRGCGPGVDSVGRGDEADAEVRAWPTLGHWAASCIDDFERVARGFMRRHVEGGDAE